MSGIETISYFKPKNNQSFYLVEDTYLKGSLKSVQTYSDISLIPTDSRKIGSLIYVIDEDRYYKFYPNTSNVILHDLSLSNIVDADSPYSASFANKYIIAEASASNITINLPEINSYDIGKSISIKMDFNSDNSLNINITPFAGSTIDGSGSLSLSTLTGVNSAVLVAAKTNLWVIISSHKI